MAEMVKGSDLAALPMLSAAAPFKAGGLGGPDYYTDVPAGDMAIRNVADLYPYPNTVRALRLNGADIRAWLERSAIVFNQIAHGEHDQLLLDAAVPSYHFDVIGGLTYQIDLAQPPRFDVRGALLEGRAGRIINLRYGNQPIHDDQSFLLVTNNHRVDGGGNFPGATTASVIFDAPDTHLDIILRYLRETGTVDPRTTANWSFAPMPGTSVLFDTGPGAAAYADQVDHLNLAHVGDGPDGFTRYRIAL